VLAAAQGRATSSSWSAGTAKKRFSAEASTGRRGMHLDGCCTSDYAGSAFCRADIKATSGGGNAERVQ